MTGALAQDNADSSDRFAGHCGAKEGRELTVDEWADWYCGDAAGTAGTAGAAGVVGAVGVVGVAGVVGVVGVAGVGDGGDGCCTAGVAVVAVAAAAAAIASPSSARRDDQKRVCAAAPEKSYQFKKKEKKIDMKSTY